jgi:hypothetical protein
MLKKSTKCSKKTPKKPKKLIKTPKKHKLGPVALGLGAVHKDNPLAEVKVSLLSCFFIFYCCFVSVQKKKKKKKKKTFFLKSNKKSQLFPKIGRFTFKKRRVFESKSPQKAEKRIKNP